MKTYYSFGIIPIHDDGRILMVCRKDTIGFMEFMKGNYSLENGNSNINEHPHIVDLFSMMTQEELEILMQENYDLAYKKLYGKSPKESHTHNQRERILFETNKDIWLEICKNVYKNGKGGWKEPEWGFPKGKKNKTETKIGCALRELYEETGITNEMITIDNTSKFVEKRCEGNKEFIYEYFIGRLCNGFNIETVTKQTNEISDVSLLSINECVKKIRHYYKNRIRILESLKK